jgi:hypothetical protein
MSPRGVAQDREKRLTIVVVAEDVPASGDAPRGDVEVPVRKARSRHAAHESTVATTISRNRPCGTIGADSASLQCQAL